MNIFEESPQKKVSNEKSEKSHNSGDAAKPAFAETLNEEK